MRAEEAAYLKGYRATEEGQVVSHLGRVLKGCLGTDGYYSFTIKDNGRSRKVDFHRLAAYQWFGEELFQEGIQVRHLNNNAQDNSKANLALGTRSQNEMDKDEGVRRAAAEAGTAKVRKLTFEQAEALRAEHARGATYDELKVKYGISKTAVSYVVNRKTYA